MALYKKPIKNRVLKPYFHRKTEGPGLKPSDDVHKPIVQHFNRGLDWTWGDV